MRWYTNCKHGMTGKFINDNCTQHEPDNTVMQPNTSRSACYRDYIKTHKYRSVSIMQEN
jgi:hypothetical protein